MNPIVPGPTSFTDAQKLLLNLLRVLQVFSEPRGGGDGRPSFSKYLFVGPPAEKPAPRFRYQVQLLATLQKTKSDVEAILGHTESDINLPEESFEPANPSNRPAFTEKPESFAKKSSEEPLSNKINDKTAQKSLETTRSPSEKQTKETTPAAAQKLPGSDDSKITSFASQKPTPSKSIPSEEASRLGRQLPAKAASSEIPLSFPRKAPVQIAAPVKNLMEQVRLAIQTLSTSIYLEKPEKAPISNILQRIKPLLDQLILAVETAQQDVHAAASESPLHEMRPLPQSSRKNLFKSKLPRFSPKEKGDRPKVEIPERIYQKMEHFQEKPKTTDIQKSPSSPTPGKKQPEITEGSPPSAKQPSDPVPVKKLPEGGLPSAKQLPYPLPSPTSIQPLSNQAEEGEKRIPLEGLENLDLLAAPYTPEKKPGEDVRPKSKKKPKSLWTRSEEEREEDKNPST